MRTRTTRNRRPSIGRSSVLEPTLELASLIRSRLARSRIARRAALRRLLAVGLALVVGWTVTGALEGAATVRDRWGATRPVVVTTADIDAGQELDADNTVVVERPVAMLPDGTLDRLPGDRRTAVDLLAGESVLEARLAHRSLGEVAARLPEGTAAVTFPRTEFQPTLEVGDRVDVYAAVGDATGTASTRVAASASVVQVAAQAVTIAVDGEDVRAAAGASLAQGVAIVVLG